MLANMFVGGVPEANFVVQQVRGWQHHTRTFSFDNDK
jgi:hypothetical protein